jgi:hypothetical protein
MRAEAVHPSPHSDAAERVPPRLRIGPQARPDGERVLGLPAAAHNPIDALFDVDHTTLTLKAMA